MVTGSQDGGSSLSERAEMIGVALVLAVLLGLMAMCAPRGAGGAGAEASPKSFTWNARAFR